MGKSILKMFHTRAVKAILGGLLLFGMAMSPAWAEEDKPTADLSLSALTRYIWRGQELSRDSIVLQPSATVGYKGFSVNLWGNLDTDPYTAGNAPGDSNNWTETDFTVGYSRAFGPVTAGIGYIYYALAALQPGAEDPQDSQEVYVSLGLNKLLSPTLTVYKEISHYKQWYFLLGVSHAFTLSEKVALKLSASASYLKSEDSETYPKFKADAATTDGKYDNFHDGMLTVSLPVTPVKYLTVTPSVSYVFPLCDDAKYEMKARGLEGGDPSDRDSSYLYGGLTVSFSF